MDKIESKVELPEGAGPLDSYARYYTIWPDGMLVGTFTRKIEQRDEDDGCSELTESFEIIETECPKLADAAIGERRWVKFDDLPSASDPECGALQIAYDLDEERFAFNECLRPLH